MNVWHDPLFWALVSMTGLVGASAAVAGARPLRSFPFLLAVVTLVAVGRIVLVLPWCPQPRFDVAWWHWVAGGLLLAVAAVVGLPATFLVKPLTPPAAGTALRERGAYAFIRHPIYLSEVLWFAGWALLWRSTIGVCLVPVWWAAFWCHAVAEESGLERALGERYRDYARRVRGRMLPGLPL